MNDVRFYKLLISANALIPLALLLTDGLNGRLGANPIEFFLRTTGVLTLTFSLITLAVTPLRKIFGWNSLIKYRRMLGLFAFFYGCLHLVTYSIFDKSLGFSAIVADVIQRPFIAIGMIAFTILVPLAITSTNGMVKRLGGKNWARLHKVNVRRCDTRRHPLLDDREVGYFLSRLVWAVLAASFLIRSGLAEKAGSSASS
jgi:sulfoxide reductase heme-binding subunit YedZ